MSLLRLVLMLSIFLPLACKTSTTSLELDHGKDDGNSRSSAQLARFAPWLDELSLVLKPEGIPDLDLITKNLVIGPARVASYNLQALARLYESEGNLFKNLRSDFKKLEDAIGTYDKWTNIMVAATKGGASSNTKQRLLEEQNSAMKNLKNLLKQDDWTGKGNKSRINRIYNDLENFDWLNQERDRKMLLSKIADELKSLEKTKFSFARLENGNGLHELRRNLKWIIIEMRVLNGLFIFNPTAKCDIPAYNQLANEPISASKYSSLKPSQLETNACEVDQCLFLGMVQLIEEIGFQKDIAEAEINSNISRKSSDLVPENVRKEIQPLYDKMVSSGLVGSLRKQISACQ